MTRLTQIENWLYLIREQNYRNGFPYFNESYKKRRKLFNPLIANTLMAIITIRDIISLFLTEDFYSILIGNFCFKFDFKTQCYLTIIGLGTCHALIEITNFKSIKVINIEKWRPNSLIAKKIRICIKRAEILFTYSLLFLGFNISFLLLSMNCSFIQLFTFGLFWSILFAIFEFVIVGQCEMACISLFPVIQCNCFLV